MRIEKPYLCSKKLADQIVATMDISVCLTCELIVAPTAGIISVYNVCQRLNGAVSSELHGLYLPDCVPGVLWLLDRCIPANIDIRKIEDHQ